MLGEVAWSGRSLLSTHMGDPPGTARVQRAALLRLDVTFLPADRQPRAAEVFRATYGVPVVDEELWELHRALGGPMPGDLRRASTDHG